MTFNPARWANAATTSNVQKMGTHETISVHDASSCHVSTSAARMSNVLRHDPLLDRRPTPTHAECSFASVEPALLHDSSARTNVAARE